MRALIACAALGLAALGPTACATAPGDAAAAPRDCFNAQTVSGFSSVDDDTVIVVAGANRSYEIDVRDARCRDLDWSTAISIRTSGSSRVCVGDGPHAAEIVTNEGDVCRIVAVRRTGAPDPGVMGAAHVGGGG